MEGRRKDGSPPVDNALAAHWKPRGAHQRLLQVPHRCLAVTACAGKQSRSALCASMPAVNARPRRFQCGGAHTRQERIPDCIEL